MAEARRWSQQVTKTSNALDLDQGVFTWTDPKKIAASLKRLISVPKTEAGPHEG